MRSGDSSLCRVKPETPLAACSGSAICVSTSRWPGLDSSLCDKVDPETVKRQQAASTARAAGDTAGRMVAGGETEGIGAVGRLLKYGDRSDLSSN